MKKQSGKQEPRIKQTAIIGPASQVATDLAAMTETAKRALADLQNYKRRVEEERGELQVYANRRILEAIFPALDNFTRAFATIPEELKASEWVKGIQAIESNLLSALQGLGLEVIDQTGIPADPNRHEVLLEGEGEPSHIVQIFEKGYTFKGRTLRPAKVMVGKKVS